MRFTIKHEIQGRMRIHVLMKKMTFEMADILAYYLDTQPYIVAVKVYERTCDVVIEYKGGRSEILHILGKFTYEAAEVPGQISQTSTREINSSYRDRLISKILMRCIKNTVIPVNVRKYITMAHSVRYVWNGMKALAKGNIEVAVLDGTAVGVSVLRKDYNTAGSIMFLLGIGELLEEWTHKKSVNDLARSMSLNVENVWKICEGETVLVSVSQVKKDDLLVIHMGNVIPFDGNVTDGEGMVNQASLTGESIAVKKSAGGYVYAGTVLEEGELTIRVRETNGSSKYEKIVAMIEESEKLKSSLESAAEHLADRLVPYTLTGSLATWLLTGNVTKAVAVLMVDYSCALKLAMPISVLSAIREAGKYKVTVKGGKFLEAIAAADTVVFDKTGTLTKARPKVAQVISFNGTEPDELLRIAACMEEHFPHSVAKAVVYAAAEKHLIHDEMHSKVEYIVAHGIATTIAGKRAVIGSYHFVFEDEGCKIPENMRDSFKGLPKEYSHLYMAVENVLEAVICIEDPIRQEAPDTIRELRKQGINKIVMMTGDSERTGKAIAARVGVDEYYAEVMPEDKSNYILKQHEAGRKVLMVGDGINDSPALSAADVGIAISDGAQLAREIADITLAGDNLYELVMLKRISDALVDRIHHNYRVIVGFNTSLIILGVLGILAPTTSALLHNGSTLLIALSSMKDLIKE